MFLNLLADNIACNHIRGEYYFAESIDSECQYMSVACDSYGNLEQ